MKVPLTVFLVVFVCSTVYGLPASTAKESSDPTKDVELLPQTSTFGEQPIVDTGFGWSSPFGNPFGGLFENIESIMAKMRQQMEAILKRFPSVYGGQNGTADFAFSANFPDNFDLNKANTTSVTKIIDGHKVVINDTEYKNTDPHGGSFFHVRVIDVQPNSDEIGGVDPQTSSEESSPKPLPPIKDRESVENSLENEIPKSKEPQKHEAKRYANIESFDEVDDIGPIGNEIDNNIETINREWNNNIAEPWGLRYINYAQRYPTSRYPWDLRYSQEQIVQSRFPQLELTQSRYPQLALPQSSYSQPNYYPSSFSLNSIPPSNNPPRYQQAVYPQRYPPFDLSRDTYVNELLAQSGAPINPDAEVFYDINAPAVGSSNRVRYPR